MTVEIRLFATLREGRGQRVELEASEGVTPRQLIERLEIPMEEIAILLVNGRNQDPDHPIEEGDYLSLFPPVGGG